MVGPHLALPAGFVVLVAGMTACGVALLGHRAAPAVANGDPAASGEPSQDLVAVMAGVVGALGAALTAAVSAQQVWSVHLARVRNYENKLADDAAAAVAAVGAEYVAPLRRERLAALLNSEAIEHSRPGLDEIQHLARIWGRWNLSLRLSDFEADEAFDRAVTALAEDHPQLEPCSLSHEIRKALAASKTAMPSMLSHLTEFISRVKSGSLQLTRGTDDPMSRLTTPT